MTITRVLSVAATATLLAALAGCGSSAPAARPKAPVPPGLAAHPATMTIGGKTYTRVGEQLEVVSAAASSIDSRLLELSYNRLSGSSDPRCAPPQRPFGYVVRQDASTVVVGIGGYRIVTASTSNGAYGCVGEVQGQRVLLLRLTAPLGHRSVRDASTSSTVPLTVGQPH